MIEVVLREMGENPNRRKIRNATFSISEILSVTDMPVDEVLALNESNEVLAKHNFAKCLALGERINEDDREYFCTDKGISFRLWTDIQDLDEYKFWMAIAQLLTDPAILPEISNKVSVLISFRQEKGIYGDEQKIYQDALILADPSLEKMGAVEALVTGLGKWPSLEKLKKAAKLLVTVFTGSPQLKARLVEEICTLAKGENAIAKNNFARCLAFGERHTLYNDFNWRDHRHHRYFRLWKKLVSEYEDCTFWTAIALILTNENIFPEIRGRVPILVDYRRDKIRFTGAMCDEEKTIYRAAKTY